MAARLAIVIWYDSRQRSLTSAPITPRKSATYEANISRLNANASAIHHGSPWPIRLIPSSTPTICGNAK